MHSSQQDQFERPIMDLPRPSASPSPSSSVTRSITFKPVNKSFWGFVPTLLRKNWLLKRKHPVAALFEVLTPVLFIILLSVVKHQVKDEPKPAGFPVDNAISDNSSLGLNLFDYVNGYTLTGREYTPSLAIPEMTMTGLLMYLGSLSIEGGRLMTEFKSPENQAICYAKVAFGGHVSLNKSSPFAVPAECEGKLSPFKLAIIPDDVFTRNYFFETMKQWYPTISISDNTSSSEPLVVPSFEDSVVFYSSEKDLEDYITSNDYATQPNQASIFGAIVFNDYPRATSDIGKFGTDFEYSLRLNSTYVGDIDDDLRYVEETRDESGASLWDAFQRSLERKPYRTYASNGFMTLQTLMTKFVNCMPEWDSKTDSTSTKCQAKQSAAVSSDKIDSRLISSLETDASIKNIWSRYRNMTGQAPSEDLSASIFSSVGLNLDSTAMEAILLPLRQVPQSYLGSTISPFPTQAYDYSPFYSIVSAVFPLFFLLTFLHMFSSILVSLITERETRSKELMKILGVKESSLVVSWYITYTIIIFVAAILQAIGSKIGMFDSSSLILLFIFFFLFSISLLAFAFLISSIFNKARTGTYIGVLAFFVMYVLSFGYNEETTLEADKNKACIFSPVAMIFAIRALADVETTGVGMNFSNMSLLVKNFRFTTALIWFAIDTVIYTILALYLEKVIKKTYGTTEKWYFPVLPSYWHRRSRGQKKNEREGDVIAAEEADDVRMNIRNPNFEEVGAEFKEQEREGEILSINRISKTFKVPGGTKDAVKGVSLNFYKNQITCLLGHNGAGKTTLISMLTGVTSPTSGDATFHGLSIREDMDAIRGSLGLCFQHDVLYPELSVQDHLEFYARVKGYTGSDLENEVTQKINEVGLADKRHTLSSDLSGGMKRKLSVAISLLGDNSLVFLDEPTSGMDPYSRRSTWEILMNNRAGRVIVLTTHFMDEADILGDRIAIMSEGEIRCCGSPLFLKERYGAGYNLTLVKKEGCDDSQVIDFILTQVPSGRILSNVGTEVSFQLPLDESPRFPELFQLLDRDLEILGIISYGISVTTMEEVFIKVAEQSDEHNQHTLTNKIKKHDGKDDNDTYIQLSDSPTSYATGGLVLFMRQFGALLQKRVRIARRDSKTMLISLVLPLALMYFSMSQDSGDDFFANDKKILLSFDKLAKEVNPKGEESILLPSYCMQTEGENSWCEQVLGEDYFSGAKPFRLSNNEIPSDQAYETDSPTVFGVKYTSPSIQSNDTSGYLLKLSEEIYNRAYEQGINNQFGGFLVHSNEEDQVFSYDVLVNTTLPHGAPAFKSMMDQSIYRHIAKQQGNEAKKTPNLRVNSYPLPQTSRAKALFTSYRTFNAVATIVLAFSFFPAPIVSLIVKEREASHNSKHQQLVSGAGLFAFWLSNYVWDTLLAAISTGGTIGLLFYFGHDSLTGGSECLTCTSSTFPAVLILFILYTFATGPFAYFVSYAFKKHESVTMYIVLFNIVSGLILLILSFILIQIESTESLMDDYLIYLFRFFPLFNFGDGLMSVVIIEITNVSMGEYGEPVAVEPFAYKNMGGPIIFLLINIIVYSILVIGIDYALTFPKLKSIFTKDPMIPVIADANEDEDVVAEAHRVLSGEAANEPVQLRALRKVYPAGNKVAVNELSFGLKRGECFGFLGINGAGKTSTMKMLTGDIVPSSGGATLGGFDILTQPAQIRRQIGYCPQFDALIDLLTVRDHLELFARIKGVGSADLDAAVHEKMKQLNLLDFENKLAGSLSGGNKRKLSVAIAMIGSPSILFLDEPSTGMDPVSRRFMWDVISEISTYNKESTVMLTTHSMEECEALCTRVGIMVGGGLKCIGSIQHLKGRFGDGLMFDAKLQSPRYEEVEQLVLEHFDSLHTQISSENIAKTCENFGHMAWCENITNTHPTGYLIANQLNRDGYVLASTFATWWIMEEKFTKLTNYLVSKFKGMASVELIERRNDSCWYKIQNNGAQHGDNGLKLSYVFNLVEQAKTQLSIREYSFSQTTLEQIFNSFASQQNAGQPIANTPTN